MHGRHEQFRNNAGNIRMETQIKKNHRTTANLRRGGELLWICKPEISGSSLTGLQKHTYHLGNRCMKEFPVRWYRLNLLCFADTLSGMPFQASDCALATISLPDLHIIRCGAGFCYLGKQLLAPQFHFCFTVHYIIINLKYNTN